MKAGRGWHERGYLSHFDGNDVVQSVTFRLADSLPRDVVQAWQCELESITDDEERRRSLRKRIDHWLDAGHGACLLKQPAIAKMMVASLKHFHEQHYRLHAYVIMPNHVHVLIEPLPTHSLSDIVRSWKTYTAKKIIRLAEWSGTVWQADYWDRYIRDEEHYRRAVAYILENPVRARLVRDVTGWPWSSAYKGDNRE